MLIIAAKIILYASIVGMIIMAVSKIPVLRTLPVSEEKERKLCFTLFFKKAKKRNKIFCLALRKEIFSILRRLKRNSFKEEKPKFSDDYWEEIRKR